MGMNFPNAPTVGQQYPSPAVAGQPVWQWDGEKWIAGPPVTNLMTVRNYIAGVNLDLVVDDGHYITDGTCTNTPVATTQFYLQVNRYLDTNSVMQIAHQLYPGTIQRSWKRTKFYPGVWTAWEQIAPVPYEGLGNGDIVVNGNMEVVIQNVFDTSVTLTNGGVVYLAEQWPFYRLSASATFVGQVYTAASIDGFQHMVGAVATVAMGAPASTDAAVFLHPIEGFRWSRLNYGLSWARPVTIGFFVFPTVSGTMHVAVRNAAGSRSYVVPVALTGGTWNYRTVTIPGCPDGVWPRENALGATIAFCFSAGTSIHAAATNAWVATNSYSAAGQTNFFATVNNAVYLTGVYAIPGSDPIPQERVPYSFRPYPLALNECMRYYQRVYHSMEFHAVAAMSRHSRTVTFNVPMRATPTWTRITTGSVTNIRGADPNNYFSAAPFNHTHWFVSGEANAAGMTICTGFVEQYSARMI